MEKEEQNDLLVFTCYQKKYTLWNFIYAASSQNENF